MGKDKTVRATVTLDTDAVRDIIEPMTKRIVDLEAKVKDLTARLMDAEYKIGSLFEDSMKSR